MHPLEVSFSGAYTSLTRIILKSLAPNEQLTKQIELLEIEREEDAKQYRDEVLRRPLKDRVTKGLSWYAVELQRISIGTGERFVVELLRNDDPPAGGSIQSGSSVSLFTLGANEKENKRVDGVVYHVRGRKMKIVLGGKDLPFGLRQSNLGVNLEFDDRSYRDMIYATRKVQEAEKGRLMELKRVLLGEKQPGFHDWEYRFSHPILNKSQEKAVQLALEAEDVGIIHGPPGTGKTTTLVHAIVEVCKRERQVLVCAPSNAAADLLTMRCAEQGLQVLRIGNPARVEEELHYHTLDETIARHPDYASLRKMRRESEAIFQRANKKKKGLSSDAYRRRREMLEEARSFRDYAKTLESYILDQVVENAQVITSTLTSAVHKLIKQRKFDTLFIDEAAQALTPACWIPIALSKRVILAGDDCQLPPTVKSMEAEKGGLGKTLFEQVHAEYPTASAMLEEQYRMHRDIMTFSSRTFYENKLKPAAGVGSWTLGQGFEAVEFVDTAGCGFDEKKNQRLSTLNPGEATLLLKHLALMLNKLEKEEPSTFERPFSIGLIAPYKAQVYEIRQQLSASPMLSSYLDYIEVNTVDGFQGQERDVIYISMTRSNKKGEIGFLGDKRRMNVAMTRGRKRLVMFGDSATLGKNKFYQSLLEYMEEIGAYKSAWEYL